MSRSSRQNPCQLCSDQNGSCILNDEGVLTCYHGEQYRDNPPDGLRYVKPAKDGMGAIFAPIASTNGHKPKVEQVGSEYVYLDAEGQPYQKVSRYYRDGKKQFAQSHRQGDQWIKGLPQGLQRIPYRLPEVIAADLVLIVEGEKDCLTAKTSGLEAALGAVTTTNSQGAGKWPSGWGKKYFQGKRVVEIPDNDQAGAEHAQQVLADLAGSVASVRVLHLPGLPEKGDLTDFLETGGTVEQVAELVRELLNQTEPEEAPKKDFADFVTATYSKSLQIEPLLEGLLWPGAATLLAGPQRTFKTNIAISIALTVARSGLWYGYLANQTKVLYIDSDQTRGWTEAMFDRYWPEWADSGQIYLLNREKLPPDGLRLPRDYKLLQAIIKHYGIGLVVVDTVRSTRELGADESDNRSTLQFMQALKEACGEASVLLLHHTGWAGRRASGSNALASQAHAEIVLNRIEEKDTRRQFLRLTMPTNRYGTELTLFFLIPEPTGDGLPARPLVLFEGKVGAYRVLRDAYGDDVASEGASTKGKAREVFDYLYKHPDSSGDQIAEGLNMKPNQARECLSRLRERSEIVQSRTTPRPVLWRCAGQECRGESITPALLHSSQGKDSGSADIVQTLHNNCTPETQSESAVQKCSTDITELHSLSALPSPKIDNSHLPIAIGTTVAILSEGGRLGTAGWPIHDGGWYIRFEDGTGCTYPPNELEAIA
jgi:AAA domain